MEKVQWQMNESFIFPEFAGVPTGAELVTVTPRFTEERTEDAVRLKGIYHIAANVTFEEGEYKAEMPGEAILISDVDVDEQAGYFEYAVPLNIDLPANAGNPLDLATAKVTCEADGQGVCVIAWEVECSYNEIVAVVEEVVAVEEPVGILENTSFKDTDEVLSFITELDDGVMSTLFRSNDVFVENKS